MCVFVRYLIFLQYDSLKCSGKVIHVPGKTTQQRTKVQGPKCVHIPVPQFFLLLRWLLQTIIFGRSCLPCLTTPQLAYESVREAVTNIRVAFLWTTQVQKPGSEKLCFQYGKTKKIFSSSAMCFSVSLRILFNLRLVKLSLKSFLKKALFTYTIHLPVSKRHMWEWRCWTQTLSLLAQSVMWYVDLVERSLEVETAKMLSLPLPSRPKFHFL